MLRVKRTIWMGCAVLLWAGVARGADTYDFDTMHTQIGFSVKHLVISTVRGNFRDFTGSIVHDPADLSKSSVTVNIKTASIDTGVQKRDDHLRSPDFFDTAKFPDLTFTSHRVSKQGEGYVAHGTLTMRGVSKEVALPFTLAGPIKGMMGEQRIAAEGIITINRRDWGLAWDKTLETGGLVVSNEVKIEFAVQGVKKK